MSAVYPVGICVFLYSILVITASQSTGTTIHPEHTTLSDGLRSTGQYTDAGGRTSLYIGLFMSFGAVDDSGIFVVCDLALKHVNEREDLLPGYELKYVLSNSECNDGKAIRSLFDQIFQEPQKLLIVGPTCSTSAQAIASTAKFWNLNVMSPTASSPALVNRNKYPTFARIIPSDTALNPSRIALMKTFNWTRVATIHQNHDLFSLSIDDLLDRLKDNNITVISSESFDEDPTNQIENLKKQDAKIIAANMYYPTARQMFCEAYKQKMYGEGYVWLLLGEYREDWYKEPDETLSCTMEELAEAVESSMYIGTQATVLGKEDTVTVAGITPSEYLILAEEHLSLFDGYTSSSQASYAYDAIWSVALALNDTIGILEETNGGSKRLEDFTYQDREMATIMLDALNDVTFQGVSGPISFDEGERIGLVNMEQLRGECPPGWFVSGRRCYIFSAGRNNFDDARNDCGNRMAELLHIRSEDELNSIEGIWRKHDLSDETKWLTSLKRTADGSFQWADGPTLRAMEVNWAPWEVEEADDLDAGSSDCYSIDLSSKRLVPVSCTSTQTFICEKPAEFRQVTFALHDITVNEIEWLSNVIWPGGNVPLDHTPKIIYTIVEMYEGIPFPVYLTACSLATTGALIAVCFLVFNIYFRQQKFMKLSSPNLNNLIIIGSVLIYASTCMTAWDDTSISNEVFLILCKSRVWLLSLGFVVSFGSMFSKTWRIHKIAALKNPKRVIITDRHLFVMVAVLVLIDVTLLASWFIFSPMRVQREDLHRSAHDDDSTIIYQPYVKFCTSTNDLYWQGALFSYKALLLIFGVFLAWETRKVTIPALNDSKLIGLCVYNVVLLSAIGVGVSLLLNTDTAGLFAFTSAIEIFCTTLTLVVIFVPKILSVFKYPEGKPVTTMRPTTTAADLSSNEDNTETGERIMRMQHKINKLEAQLARRSHTQSHCGFWIGKVMCALCAAEDGEDADVESSRHDTTGNHTQHTT